MDPAGTSKLRIIIVGAGIGGLTMANLLERASVPYVMLEKASAFKPLGSAINLACQVNTFLDQLGIYEDLHKVSKEFKNLSVHTLDQSTGKISFKGSFDNKMDFVTEFGYGARMMARPDLVEALVKRIPKEKILFNKKVTGMTQNAEKATVTTADGDVYEGDLVIASDGCYSAVRASVFKELEKTGSLPSPDQSPLDYTMDCIVGVTKELDLTQFPALSSEKCEFQVMLTKQKPSVSIWMMPLTRNRMGWMINQQMSKEQKEAIGPIYPNNNSANANAAADKQQPTANTKVSDWGIDAAKEMCDRFRDYPTPYGTQKMADLFDQTPPELISKVMLEEKFFETWQDGRVVMIGDACHKVLPFAAVGATNAMLDALQLANLIYDLPSTSYQDIRKLLKTFYESRREYGRGAVAESAGASTLFHTQGVLGNLARFLVLRVVPDWLIRKKNAAALFYRPQATFLPFVTNTGTAPGIHQEYSPRYLRELKLKEAGTSEANPAEAENEQVVEALMV